VCECVCVCVLSHDYTKHMHTQQCDKCSGVVSAQQKRVGLLTHLYRTHARYQCRGVVVVQQRGCVLTHIMIYYCTIGSCTRTHGHTHTLTHIRSCKFTLPNSDYCPCKRHSMRCSFHLSILHFVHKPSLLTPCSLQSP